MLRWTLAALALGGVCLDLGAAEEGVCDPNAITGRCMIMGCFMGHGENVKCDGTSCVCKRGYCSENGQTCVKMSTTTENPNPATYACDAVGIEKFVKSGKFTKLVGQCLMLQCAGDYITSGKNLKCCSARCTRDTLQAKVPECWEKKPVQDKFNGLVFDACPLSVLDLVSVSQASHHEQYDNTVSPAQSLLAQERRNDITHLRSSAGMPVSLGLALSGSTIGAVTVMALVGIAIRKWLRQDAEQSSYKHLVEVIE